MKKSSKRLIISTQAKNGHGFRVRSEGIDLSGFIKNPLLLWMHKRPTGESTEEVLPLGYWEDVKLEGDTLSGIPVFDDKDPFAMKIYHKVENGTIRMASAGLTPIEFKEDGEDLWLWLSSLFEASLCDIGSNKEALAVELYDSDFAVVTLSEVYQPLKDFKTKNMKITLTAKQANLLSLTEGAELEPTVLVDKLVTLAENLNDKNVTLTKEKKDVEDKLADAKKEATQGKMKVLLTDAQDKGKITKDQVPHFEKMEFKDAEALLATMPENRSVAAQLADKDGSGETDGLMKLSWKELDKQGKLVLLKEKNLEGFKEKYKAQFGSEYKG